MSIRLKAKASILGIASLLLLNTNSNAQVIGFSLDFENMPVAQGWSEDEPPVCIDDSDTSFGDTGFEVAANVFNNQGDHPGAWMYFYGWYAGPNSGCGGFAEIEGPDSSGNDSNDETTADGSSNYLNVYSDYNNRTAHDSGAMVNAIVANNMVIEPGDIGKTVIFSFDAKRPKVIDNGLGDESLAVGVACSEICTQRAYVKTQDPENNYADTNFYFEDMTAISQSEWTSYSITLDLTDPLLENQNLQVGFETFATNDDSSGVYYDNVTLTVQEPEPEATDVPFPAGGLALFGSVLLAISIFRKKLNAIN